ncbi:MAG: hypothetical protein EOO41_01175, partial [Methanobacteriota archaeon]
MTTTRRAPLAALCSSLTALACMRARQHDAVQVMHSLPPKFNVQRPDTRSFNIFIFNSARQGNKEEVRRWLSWMRDSGLKPDTFTLAGLALVRTHSLARSNLARATADAHRGGSAESVAAEEAELDTLVVRTVDEIRSNPRVRFNRAMFNQIMQAYFRLGRPRKALDMLSSMSALNAAPAHDTARVIFQGLCYSGGTAAHGLPRADIPASWGGSMSEEAYNALRAHATDMRARIAAAAARRESVADAIPAEAAAKLRLASLGHLLAAVRVWQYAQAVNAPVATLPSPLPGVDMRAWLESAQGVAVLRLLQCFRPFSSDPDVRAAE